jgi:hypothetical protein
MKILLWSGHGALTASRGVRVLHDKHSSVGREGPGTALKLGFIKAGTSDLNGEWKYRKAQGDDDLWCFDGMQWAVRTAMQPCYAGFCLHGNCPLFLQIMKAEVWDPGFSMCCFFQRRV